MGAIAVGHDHEAKLPITISEQERGVTRNTAAVRQVAITVADFGPPCQTEAGGFVAPKVFNCPFELIVLAREHLV